MLLILLVWFVHLLQQFNPVIWLVNLNKCRTNAKEGSVSIAIEKETEQYHLKKLSVLIRICVSNTLSKILTFPMRYMLTVTLNLTRKSMTMDIILFLKWIIMIQGNQSICSLHWSMSGGLAQLQKWQLWHTNEW